MCIVLTEKNKQINLEIILFEYLMQGLIDNKSVLFKLDYCAHWKKNEMIWSVIRHIYNVHSWYLEA